MIILNVVKVGLSIYCPKEMLSQWRGYCAYDFSVNVRRRKSKKCCCAFQLLSVKSRTLFFFFLNSYFTWFQLSAALISVVNVWTKVSCCFFLTTGNHERWLKTLDKVYLIFIGWLTRQDLYLALIPFLWGLNKIDLNMLMLEWNIWAEKFRSGKIFTIGWVRSVFSSFFSFLKIKILETFLFVLQHESIAIRYFSASKCPVEIFSSN